MIKNDETFSTFMRGLHQENKDFPLQKIYLSSKFKIPENISKIPKCCSSDSEYEIDGKDSDFDDPHIGEHIYDLMEVLDKSLRLKRYQHLPRHQQHTQANERNHDEEYPAVSPAESELPASSNVSTLSSQKQNQSKRRKRRKSKRLTRFHFFRKKYSLSFY